MYRSVSYIKVLSVSFGQKTAAAKRNLVFHLFLFLFLVNLSILLPAQTISAKRGVAGDLLNNADCLAADTLTWFYNWANTPNASVISSSQNYLEYCPMLWNGSWNPTALNNYLNAHPEVKYLLTFNEPNFSVQSNMTPAQAAALWPQVEAIATAHNLQIVSPAMSYCSGTCISGYNNMQGTVWLDDFFTACPGCRVDHIAVHIYDTWYYGFSGVLNLYKKYNRPIWVTEFDYSGSTNATQQASLMVDVLDLMEKDPNVFRYSWFLVRSSPSATSTDIFSQTTGTLAGLGNVYEHMSSYDNNYFHNVNARIEAEYYISKSVIYCDWNGSACNWPYSILLEPTTDVDGRLDAYHFASPVDNANDTVFYNVDIPTTQSYTIDFRVNSTAASTLSLHTANNTVVGTTASLNTAGAWQTKTLTGVNLTAGQQRIYLTAANGSALKLNWLRINCSSNCGTLPVELEYFNASNASEHSTNLTWATASEKNNDAFLIEKSEDGLSFHVIGSVTTKNGSTNISQTYSFLDTDVYENTTYYRLKQVDTDGGFSYSPIRKVSRVAHTITINSHAIVTELSEAQTIFYSLTTSSGLVVKQGSYQANAGVTEKSLPLTGLASGIYLVQVVSNDAACSGKILQE